MMHISKWYQTVLGFRHQKTSEIEKIYGHLHKTLIENLDLNLNSNLRPCDVSLYVIVG